MNAFDDLLKRLSSAASTPKMPRLFLNTPTAVVKQALYAAGWQWMPTVYQWYIDPKREGVVDQDRLAARIEEYIPFGWTGDIHYDLEHDVPDHDGNHIAHINDTDFTLGGIENMHSRGMFADIFALSNKLRPDAKPGNFGLGSSEKWPSGGKFWSDFSDEQKKEYISRHLDMPDVYGPMSTLMTRTYDKFPRRDPDNKNWMDRVQAEWLDGTIETAKAIMSAFGIEKNIHCINHRADGVALTRPELWKYQVLPAITAGFDLQWWGATASPWYMYEQKSLLKREQYAMNVKPELLKHHVDPSNEAEVRAYFDRDAIDMGGWLMNKVMRWATGAAA